MVKPGEVCVIQRGIKFKVNPTWKIWRVDELISKPRLFFLMDLRGDVSKNYFHELSFDRYHNQISWRYLDHVLLCQTLDLWVGMDWQTHETSNRRLHVLRLINTHSGRLSTSEGFQVFRCIRHIYPKDFWENAWLPPGTYAIWCCSMAWKVSAVHICR